jgi:hypothetical protein
MRIYQNFKEAVSEVKRDLVEMGIKVHPKTYQDKNIADNPDFETMELQNYIYTVVEPQFDHLDPVQPWANAEWGERVCGVKGVIINPGDAWKLRREVWQQFLQSSNRLPEPDELLDSEAITQSLEFAYTYSERLAQNMQVERVIERLKEDHDSRQLFISIWDVMDTSKLGGISRVPCSLGYLLQCRKGKLNMTYLQRSADFATHFVNDKYVADHSDLKMGTFTHWVGSLHIFKKDAEGVF